MCVCVSVCVLCVCVCVCVCVCRSLFFTGTPVFVQVAVKKSDNTEPSSKATNLREVLLWLREREREKGRGEERRGEERRGGEERREERRGEERRGAERSGDEMRGERERELQPFDAVLYCSCTT